MPAAELISVGTELLLGNIVDTNQAFLSQKLSEVGINVYFRQNVGDHAERLKSTFLLALSRSDIVILTGGLGPTYDDVTKSVVASSLGLELRENAEQRRKLEEYFSARPDPMPKENLLQALVPEGAEVLENDWGTAPGIYISHLGKQIFLLPGVPREMKPMFCSRVLPRLPVNGGLYSVMLHLYGIGESRVDELLSDLMTTSLNPTVAPYAKTGEVHLRVTCRAGSEEEAKPLLDDKICRIEEKVGEFIYSRNGENLQQALVFRLKKKGKTVSFAESCTGGLCAQRVTEVPGSSAVLGFSAVTYSEEMKEKILGVSEETLAKHSVYSRECALEMARGVKKLSGADIGVATTGIAGPDGGTKENPVGTVYIAAVSDRGERCEVFHFAHSTSEREYVREMASSRAIAMALQCADAFRG